VSLRAYASGDMLETLQIDLARMGRERIIRMASAEASKQKVLINPAGTEVIYDNWQFSQAVRVGDMVWVSGQVGVDMNLVPAEGIEAQARQAFENLKLVLEEAGSSMGDIVELVTYHTSIEDIAAVSAVKSEFIPKDYPAHTAIGVKQLVLPELLLEIRATAVVGCGATSE